MKIIVKLLIFSLLLCRLTAGYAQIDDDLLEDDTLNLKNAYVPELEAVKTEKRELRKARQKKNTFLGIKTKKSFIRKITATQTVLEQFNFMKAYSEPAPYMQNVVWYDRKSGKLVSNPPAKKIDKGSYRLLHGPYYRTQNGRMTDTGFFFMGVKHGRWEKFATNGHLLEKTQFQKGWLKHSKITYYDVGATKIKEVTPVHHNKITGDYFQFFEDGRVAVSGHYDHDVRVGLWTEYFPGKFKKKEIQYANSPYDADFQPVVLREWKENGELITTNENKNLTAPPNPAENVTAQVPDKNNNATENQTPVKKEILPAKTRPKAESPKTERADTEPPKEEPKKEVDKSVINLAAIVKLKDRSTGKIEKYRIVPDGDGDLKRRWVSENSLIGKNLMGKKVGQVARIRLESGFRELEVLEINYLE